MRFKLPTFDSTASMSAASQSAIIKGRQYQRSIQDTVSTQVPQLSTGQQRPAVQMGTALYANMFSDSNFNTFNSIQAKNQNLVPSNNQFDIKECQLDTNRFNNGNRNLPEKNSMQQIDFDSKAGQKMDASIRLTNADQGVKTIFDGKSMKDQIISDIQDKNKWSVLDNRFILRKNRKLKSKINSIQSKKAEQISYSIKHFDDFEKRSKSNVQLQSNLILPHLGRMSLASSLKPFKDFKKLMSTMQKCPHIYVPLIFLPKMAIAEVTPPGFEDFNQGFDGLLSTPNFLEFMVNLNKNCILEVLHQLQQFGIFNQSAGYAIVIWAIILKLLTSPFYENALKYPSQMEKAVQSVIEAELNEDQLNMDDGANVPSQRPESSAQQNWTNPFMAQLSPMIYDLGIQLPFFFVEAKSLIELAKERPEFQQPFLWLPSLTGPTQEFGMNWMINNNFGDSMPYIAIHIFIIVQMFINATIWKKMAMPDHTDHQKKYIDVEYAIAILIGSAALIAPAAVSINWYIAQILSISQFFFYREKLKKIDGLDLQEIRQKDEELRSRIRNTRPQTMPASEPELQFEYDQQTGSVMAKQTTSNPKNERQRNFLKVYNQADSNKK